MTLPDDDLEAIADATDIHDNVGTRDRRGRKRGSGMPWNKGPQTQLQRIFIALKGRTTRRQNKANAQRPAHD